MGFKKLFVGQVAHSQLTQSNFILFYVRSFDYRFL
jgi:hypothetical protein